MLEGLTSGPRTDHQSWFDISACSNDSMLYSMLYSML
jgi:hypothetical protein